MKKTICWFSVILLILIFCSYQTFLSHVVYYNEQHQLFLFSWEYLKTTVHWNGLLKYLTNFIVQFFYYGWLGSLLMAVMLTSIYVAIQCTARKISGHVDFFHFGILASLIVFTSATTSDFNLSILVGAFIASVGAMLLSFLPLGKWKVVPVVAFLALMFWPVTLTEMLAVTIALLLSILSGKYVGSKIETRKCAVRLRIQIISIIVLGAVGYAILKSKPKTDERVMILTHQAANQGDWDKVMELSEDVFSTEQYPQFMLYYYNMALYNKGELLDKLFTIPQKKADEGLFLAWSNDSWKFEEGGMVYDKMNYWNAAIHWESEALVKFGENAPHLLNLTRYYIKIGRPKVAQKFINLLSQTMFYRDSAAYFSQHINDVDKDFVDSQFNVPGKDARIIENDDLGPEVYNLLAFEPTNKMAFEYMMADLMLTNRLGILCEKVLLMKKLDYQKVPKALEEALCLVKYADPKKFESLGIPVSSEAWKRFQEYSQAYGQNDRITLQTNFSDTYWYYVHFVCPKGSNITM